MGQEPIVMARDRGQVNRKLMGIVVAEGGPLPAHTKLFKDGAEAGQVTSSVISPLVGKAIALAYIRRGYDTPGIQLEVERGGKHRSAEVAALSFGGSP